MGKGAGVQVQKNHPGPWGGFGPVVCHSYIPLTPEAAWLNNCVGHYNHRYFFSFCLFMTMGCIYCSISGWEMFRDAYAAIEVRRQAPALTLLCTEAAWAPQAELAEQGWARPGLVVTLLPFSLLLRGPQLPWSCGGVRAKGPLL